MASKYKSVKEARAAKLQAQSITLAAADMAVRARPVNTWSARMPAYCYTAACPDAELREPIRRRRGWTR